MLRIKGDKERFPVLEFGDSDALEVGDLVLAIGDPFGVGQTVTQGIVSALARTAIGISDYRFFIQTDAAINPGNSGGALVDMNGRLVGINSAIYSRSGGSHGIGFAIPANMVRVVVASAEGGSGAVKRPWLGAKLQEVTPDIAESLGLQRPTGALVANVAADSPAARAGLKTGDVIVSVDGTEVDDPTPSIIASPPSRWAARRNSASSARVKPSLSRLACRPLPDTPREEVEIRARSPFLGATVANLSPALADEMRLDPSRTASSSPASPTVPTAQSIGFQKGDMIVSVNNQKIEKPADLAAHRRRRRPSMAHHA